MRLGSFLTRLTRARLNSRRVTPRLVRSTRCRHWSRLHCLKTRPIPAAAPSANRDRLLFGLHSRGSVRRFARCGAFERALRQIPEKSRIASRLPIRRSIVQRAHSRMGCAEKRMLFGVHHNAHMSLPHNQITWLRVAYTQELAGPSVKIQGADVGIGVSSLLVQVMHQVGTIRRETLFVIRPGDPLCNGSPFGQAE